ncbi:MAG: TonB-dependent receptor [Prolixibacteraceae bacterium]
MKKLFYLLLFFLISSGAILAQVPPPRTATEPGTMIKNGKIKGSVIDSETKTPMEYANIAVYRKQDAKLVSGGIADASGVFEIKDLPYGQYFVEAVFIGFDKKTIQDLKIQPNTPTVELGTIALEASHQQIGEVDVVAERNRIEYKIDKKVINVANDINAAGGTAVTALENTPSVEVDIDGNVSLRGSSSFTVLIDGRPSVLSGSDALRQIPSSTIENIEIITNPSVKYDPDGMAGIINVVMKKNVLSGLNGIVNVNVGTGDKYGTDLMLNYKTKKYNVFLGGNLNDETNYGTMKMTRESYSNDTTTFLTTDGRRDMTRGGSQIKGGLDFYPTDKTTVTLSSQLGTYKFDSYGGGNIHNYTVPGDLDIYSIQKNTSIRNGNYVNANASFQTKFNESGMHKLEGSFDYRNRDGKSAENNDEFLTNSSFANSSEFLTRVNTSDNSTSNDYRMKLDYTLPLKEGAKFEAGLQSRIENEKESFYFENYDLATKTFINDPKFTSDMDFTEAIHSVYSTYSGKTTGISYQLGLRGEYNKRTIEHHANVNNTYSLDLFDVFPSIHLSYELASENQLMASYSKRVNRPDGRDLDPFPNYMNQYTIRIGNPDLKPEYTDSYEFSYMRKFGTSFLSLETFYRTTNDLITRLQEMRNDGIIYMTMDNLNRDYSIGGELMGNFNFTKWLLVNSSFSLYNYQLKGEVLGTSVDRQSTNYSGRLNATIKFNSDSRMQLTGMYRGPSVSAQGDQKGMMFTNLSYRQDFMKKKLSATLSVRDLFGTGKFQGTSAGDNFKSTFKMQREPRVFMLTLSYKINNYKMDKQAPSDQQGQQGVEDIF